MSFLLHKWVQHISNPCNHSPGADQIWSSRFFFQVSSNPWPNNHTELNPVPHCQPRIRRIGPGAGGPRKLQTITTCQQPQQISQTSVAYQASSIFPTLISTRPAPAFISKALAWYLQKKKKIKKIAPFLQMQLVGRTAFEIWAGRRDVDMLVAGSLQHGGTALMTAKSFSALPLGIPPLPSGEFGECFK